MLFGFGLGHDLGSLEKLKRAVDAIGDAAEYAPKRRGSPPCELICAAPVVGGAIGARRLDFDAEHAAATEHAHQIRAAIPEAVAHALVRGETHLVI